MAGQAAYTLVLTPRDARSTVRRVLIALDAKHSFPLRVQVFGAAAKPAFEIGFTSISFARPAASVFRFTAPHGSQVSQDLFDLPGKGAGNQRATHGTTRTLGHGWVSVLELPAGQGLSALTGGGKSSSVLNHLMTSLPNGDQLLSSALLNVLVTHDGRTFVGAVSPAVLQQAAAGTLG